MVYGVLGSIIGMWACIWRCVKRVHPNRDDDIETGTPLNQITSCDRNANNDHTSIDDDIADDNESMATNVETVHRSTTGIDNENAPIVATINNIGSVS